MSQTVNSQSFRDRHPIRYATDLSVVTLARSRYSSHPNLSDHHRRLAYGPPSPSSYIHLTSFRQHTPRLKSPSTTDWASFLSTFLVSRTPTSHSFTHLSTPRRPFNVPRYRSRPDALIACSACNHTLRPSYPVFSGHPHPQRSSVKLHQHCLSLGKPAAALTSQ